MAYEPTDWQPGDKITSVKLNKIELELDKLDAELEEIETLLADI